MIHRSKRVANRILGGLRYRAQAQMRGRVVWGRHHPRFVIYSRGRSGSSLLVDLLNQLPDVHCDKEILGRRIFAPTLFVRGCEAFSPRRAYGFKLLTYQLPEVQKVDARPFMRRLHRSGYRIIYLRRENMLRQVLSGLHASHRGHWHHLDEDGAIEPMPMVVDLETLHSSLRDFERLDRCEAAVLSGFDFLDLVYERDLQDAEAHQQTVDRVARYLGVRSASVRPGLARMMSNDLTAFISNYEEVLQYIKATEYRRYLPL